MRRFNRFGLIAVLAVAAAAAPALAGNVTVGRFYTEIARATHLQAVDAASAEAGLRGAGLPLPQLDLGKELTEGDMTVISQSLGLSVKTSRPYAAVSELQMNRFMASFGSDIRTVVIGDDRTPQAPTSGGGDDDDDDDRRKKKKKKKKSRHNPGHDDDEE